MSNNIKSYFALFVCNILVLYASISWAQPNYNDLKDTEQFVDEITNDPIQKNLIIALLSGFIIRFPGGEIYVENKNLNESCWTTTTSVICFFTGQGNIGISYQGIKRVYAFDSADRSICYTGPHHVFCDRGKIIAEFIDPDIRKSMIKNLSLDREFSKEEHNNIITDIELEDINENNTQKNNTTYCTDFSHTSLCILNAPYKAYVRRGKDEKIYETSNSSLCYAGPHGAFCDNAKRLTAPKD